MTQSDFSKGERRIHMFYGSMTTRTGCTSSILSSGYNIFFFIEEIALSAVYSSAKQIWSFRSSLSNASAEKKNRDVGDGDPARQPPRPGASPRPRPPGARAPRRPGRWKVRPWRGTEPFELYRARSRLYRNEILQENTRWKALAEIFTMHSFALP